MKTKTTSLFLSLFVLCISIAAAQTEDENEEPKQSINSNRKYKNEAALDLSPLNFLLGANNYSVFFRRHFSKTKDIPATSRVKLTTYHAYRFRVGSNLSFASTDLPDIKTAFNNTYFNSQYTGINNNSSFFIRIGKEKQIRSKQFEIYYGYDFSASYYSETNGQVYLNAYYTNTSANTIYNVNVKALIQTHPFHLGYHPLLG